MSVTTAAAPLERNRPMSGEERKVIFASSLGTVFEWYDFYLYGSLAVVIGNQFFSQFDPATWLARPQMVAAQGLAAIMLALASWQVFGWLTAFRPVVGDVPYAMTLVAASPAAVYLGGFQIDLQSLGIWSLVGLAGWLISENGPIGSRLSSTRLHLP